MAVFTDEANSYDLTITTAGDWTIHAADLPNGDPSASLSTTLNQNAVWTGEDFCLPAGSGSEAATVEAWIKVTSDADTQFLINCRTDATGTGADTQHWAIYNQPSLAGFYVSWFNRTGAFTDYLFNNSGAVLAGWTHLVVVFRCGSTRSITTYINRAQVTTNASPSGTPTTAATGVYQFFVGSSRYNALNEMTDHMAKLAFYDRALTTDEINAHYFRMVAA